MIKCPPETADSIGRWNGLDIGQMYYLSGNRQEFSTLETVHVLFDLTP
jgi:hypothetical protein